MKKLNKFKPLMKFVKEDKWRIIFASICISITALSEILTGYLMGSAVESVTSMQLKEALTFMAVYYAISFLINAIIQNVGDGILLTVESKLTRKLGYFTYAKALNLPAVAYEEKSSGEIINRITNDADSLSFTIGRIIRMITDLIATSLLLIYIFINSWIIGLEIVLFMAILGSIIKKYAPKIETTHKSRKKEQDRFLLIVNESIRGIREIKTLGIKKNLLTNVKEIITSIFKVSKDEVILQKKFRIITIILKNSLEVGVFSTCIFLLYFKQINLTFFIAMTYYIYRYMWLIEETNDLVENIGVGKAINYLEYSDFVIYVADSSVPMDESDNQIIGLLKNKTGVVLLNKSDLDVKLTEEEIKERLGWECIEFSNKTKSGLEQLSKYIKNSFLHGEISFNDQVYLTNIRHKEAVKYSLESLMKAKDTINAGLPEDFVTIDMMDAYKELGLINGETASEDLVNKIFNDFCMGK